MNNRILYLSYDGMTDPLGQSQVLPYLIGLSNKGYQITLMSFEKRDRFLKNKNDIKKLINKSDITWIPLPYHKNPPIISTIWDIISLKKEIKKIQRKKAFNIVHCRGYITAIVGSWMKKKWKTRFLFDMRGFFADERVEGGIWNLKNPIYKLVYQYFKKKEKYFFTYADHVVSLTHKGEKIIRTLDYIPQKFECTVIPCCVDMELFKFDDSKTSKETNNLNLCYLGSIGTWYMLDEMLDFYKLILLHYPTALFTFYTHEKKELIESTCLKKEIPLSSIIIYAAKREELPQLLKKHQLSIFFIKPVFSKQASSPTKQGELMAMGIPVICNSGVGDTDEIIKLHKSGYLIDCFDKKSYQKAIDHLNEIINLPKENMTEGAEKYFSLKKGIEKYDLIYQKLIKSD